MQLRYIDSLRGLAILGVILVHTSQYGTSIYTAGEQLYPGFINRIFEQGARGVQLFYVVSAFTLFLSYYSRRNQAAFNLKDYVIRRVFRVTPLFWIGILFFGIITPLILKQRISIEPTQFFANIFLLHSIIPEKSIVPGGWTISVEVFFYILLPFLYKTIKNTNQAVFFTVITIIISVVYNFVFFNLFEKTRFLEYFHFTSFPNQLPLFGFGAIAYFISIKKDYNVYPYLLFTLSLMTILQLTLVRFIPNHIIFGIPFMLLVIIGDRISILNNKALEFIGKISFSAYFVHFAILFWMDHLNFVDFFNTNTHSNALINLSIRFLITTSVVVVISTFLYYYIELPFIKIGKKLIKN